MEFRSRKEDDVQYCDYDCGVAADTAQLVSPDRDEVEIGVARQNRPHSAKGPLGQQRKESLPFHPSFGKEGKKAVTLVTSGMMVT